MSLIRPGLARRASARSSSRNSPGAGRRSTTRSGAPPAAGRPVGTVPVLLLGAAGLLAVGALAGAGTTPAPSAPGGTPDVVSADLAAHAPKDTGGLGTTEGLTPQLTRAITRAREAAAADGIERIGIISGARSAQTQQQLFDEAVAKYGSAAEASKWVLPPNKSAHVKGEAIDVNPYAAAQWLEKNGVKFGLCRRYANEYWHFEVLAPAKGQKCPALEANAAHTE